MGSSIYYVSCEIDLTTTPLPVEKRRKAQEVTTKGIVNAGNL